MILDVRAGIDTFHAPEFGSFFPFKPIERVLEW